MMNLKKIMCACMLGLPYAAFAQVAVTPSEGRQMVAEVQAAAAKTRSLQCDFRQTKQLSLLKTTMVSEGKMYYQGGTALRWEYVKPYDYIFVLSGNKVMLKSSRGTDVIDVQQSRMFQQIARIMMHSVTGKCLTDDEDFSVDMFRDGKQWVARLVPRQKEMAHMFSCIRLHVDPVGQMVTSVELVEKGGDTTLIEMKNVKKNVSLEASLFQVK